ncbi:MAG: MinD/ParA family protein [Pseudomonadales bacterium]
MNSKKTVQVVAITGGKGGVGKTNIAINLSMALAKLGQRVALLDADLGLANIDVLLGLKPKRNLQHVLDGECSLPEVMLDGPGGIKIIPASSGTQKMVHLSAGEHAGLVHEFSAIGGQIDTLVIDTAAGISNMVVSFVKAAHEAVIVVCDEPSSLTDAYALIKLLHTEYAVDRFRVLANMTSTAQQGRQLFDRLMTATDHYLDVNLQYLGQIPFDENLRQAVKKQRSILEMSPRTKSSQAFRSLAQKIALLTPPDSPRGHLEFFIEQLAAAPAPVPAH